MAEMGLKLDKADFAINGFEVDERKYPRQGPKEPSTRGRKEMKAGDALTIDLFEEESDDVNDGDDLLQLGQDNTAVEPVSLEASNDEEEEAHSEGQSIPLVGSWLGVVNVDEDENEDLAMARLQATP